MTRRDLLLGAAAVTGVVAARPVAAAPRRQKREAVLARIGMMTLNFTSLLKTPHQAPSAERTLDLFDLPEMYADTYGVHNIELQHYHMASTDPSYFRALRERIDRAHSKTIQLVVEFGGLNISAPDHNFLPRRQAVDLTNVWIDRAAILGCPRIMVNQGQLSPENRQYAIDTLKLMVDYGKTRGVMVTLETRGGTPAPTASPTDEPAWVLLNDVARSAGAFINIDVGGVRAGSQAELHAAFDGLLPNSSGSMHTRVSTVWDLPTALRYVESRGYTGFYSIEARGHEGTRPVYDAILETLG